MKYVKLFENFEGAKQEETSIVEGKEFYIEKGYVTSADIKSKEDIIKLIEAKFQDGLEELSKKYKLPKFTYDIRDIRGSKYVSFKSEKITGKDLGVFEGSMKHAEFGSFNGGEILSSESEGEFYFMPRLWFTLHINYEALSGGRNGLSHPLGEDESGYKRDDLFFSIEEGVFRNIGEQIKFEKSTKK